MNIYSIKKSLLLLHLRNKGKYSHAETSNSYNPKIDFVITWVDSTDKVWQKEKEYYEAKAGKAIDASPERYRDWEILKYWFRTAEKYAPWVNRIHLVTCGQVPEWLNTSNPKLNLVFHKSFMAENYLPTFNCNPIEMNLHRIKGLEECFVNFNDDTFLCSEATPEDFFFNGLPKYCASAVPLKNNRENGVFRHLLFGNLGLINGYFGKSISKLIKENPEKWFANVYDSLTIKANEKAFADSYIYGMHYTHLPTPFRKEAFKQVWNVFSTELDKMCENRLRTPLDYTHQLVSLWDIVQGKFIPVDKNHYGYYFEDFTHDMDRVRDAFEKQKYKTVCLNDTALVKEMEFETSKKEIISMFEDLFPEKSEFEV